jgi:hypothetical protein
MDMQDKQDRGTTNRRQSVRRHSEIPVQLEIPPLRENHQRDFASISGSPNSYSSHPSYPVHPCSNSPQKRRTSMDRMNRIEEWEYGAL